MGGMYPFVGIQIPINSNSYQLANDLDPNGKALTAILVNDPTHGQVELGDDGDFAPIGQWTAIFEFV